MKAKYTLIALTALSLATFGCGKKGGGDTPPPAEPGHEGHDHAPGEHDAGEEGDDAHAGHDHSAQTHGPHGGAIVEVGAHLAALEVIHTPADGSLAVYVLAADIKTPLDLEKAPKLNLVTAEGPVQLTMEGSGSTFTVKHAALNGEPKGRIALELEGKNWQLPIAHEH